MTLTIKSRASIKVPKGAQKKRKKFSFSKYFPKVKKINPNETPKYVSRIKKRIFKRKPIYK